MPGELGALPGSQFAVERMFDLGEFHPQLADFVLRGRLSGRNGREFFDLFFDLADRFFKLEIIAHNVLKDIDIGEGNTDTLSRIMDYDNRKWPLCLALLQPLPRSDRWG